MASLKKTPYYFVHTQTHIGLGRGGQVFRGTLRPRGDNDGMPQEVAVKMVERDGDDPSVMLEIHNEVDMLHRIQHDNIVKCCNVYDDENRYFYVFFEYFSGGNLLNRITSKQHFSEEKARDLTLRILAVVEYLHHNGIVHRDLKPENIMFATPNESADIKLIDFGFATTVDEEGYCHREILGTALYMAPEIWRGDEYGRPVDMWAVGVIVHLMLCGTLPFPFSVKEFTELAKKEELVVSFQDECWEGMSHEARSFVGGLLCQNPANRLTVAQACEHPWFHLEHGQLGGQHLHKSVSKMRQFQSWNKMRIFLEAIKRLKRQYKRRKEAKALLAQQQQEEQKLALLQAHQGDNVDAPMVRLQSSPITPSAKGVRAQVARDNFHQLVLDLEHRSSPTASRGVTPCAPIVGSNTASGALTSVRFGAHGVIHPCRVASPYLALLEHNNAMSRSNSTASDTSGGGGRVAPRSRMNPFSMELEGGIAGAGAGHNVADTVKLLSLRISQHQHDQEQEQEYSNTHEHHVHVDSSRHPGLPPLPQASRQTSGATASSGNTPRSARSADGEDGVGVNTAKAAWPIISKNPPLHQETLHYQLLQPEQYPSSPHRTQTRWSDLPLIHLLDLPKVMARCQNLRQRKKSKGKQPWQLFWSWSRRTENWRRLYVRRRTWCGIIGDSSTRTRRPSIICMNWVENLLEVDFDFSPIRSCRMRVTRRHQVLFSTKLM